MHFIKKHLTHVFIHALSITILTWNIYNILYIIIHIL